MRQIIEQTPVFRRRDEFVEIDFCDADAAGGARVTMKLACSRRMFIQALDAANAFEAELRAEEARAASKVIRLPRRRRKA